MYVLNDYILADINKNICKAYRYLFILESMSV